MSTISPLWRQIQRQNFSRLTDLLDFLQVDEHNVVKVLDQAPFPLNLPRRLAEKIAKNDVNDPLFRQFVPLQDELISTPGYVVEPLEDSKFRKTKKTLVKYNGRALVVTTSACAMNCRFCFRQNFPYETEVTGFEEELKYLSEEKELREVILSGGDPLSLGNQQLGNLFSAINAIDHIERIRIHTRFPIGIPERIDEGLLAIFQNSTKQIVFIIHCNHPRELDADVVRALKNIQKLGIPVLNQSVLLKGVNDQGPILLELSEALVRAGILPYYLHQHDRVAGTAHFAVSDEVALELVNYVQKNTSGFAVPRLVREIPGESSKTPLITRSSG